MNGPRDERTVLVTGGAGYVGSHACKALVAAGHVPVTLDNLCRGHREAVRWGPLEQGDVLDAARLDQVFEHHRPQSVMHFAALANVGESMSDPDACFRNNVTGTLNLLEAMRRHGVTRFVFSSSCAVYGVPERVPIVESAQRSPINPYGSSKLMVETMLEQFASNHGVQYASLRYFNAAGADPDGEIGERHEPETHLIPLVLQAAAGVRPYVEVYGEDYATPDGTCVRDFVHVCDIADAHVRALEYLERGGAPLCANLGSARGASVREIIRRCGEITGRAIAVRAAPRRAGDPPRLIADAALAHSRLGWAPTRSDLETILETAWDWQQRQAPPPR
jgi:UDP-glucose-4-epimerase GalE